MRLGLGLPLGLRLGFGAMIMVRVRSRVRLRITQLGSSRTTVRESYRVSGSETLGMMMRLGSAWSG